MAAPPAPLTTASGASPGASAAPVSRRRARRAWQVLAAAYLASLVALIVAFRFVGERWWLTTAALYLPRAAFLVPVVPITIGLALTGRRPERAREPRLVPLLFFLACLAPSLLLMGFVLPWPVSADPGAPTIRVLSFNVNSTRGGEEQVLAEIAKYAPDIVLLQEIGWPDHLASLLAQRYPAIRSVDQFVVASKFPITSAVDPVTLTPSGRRRTRRWLAQVVDTPIGPVSVYDVHPVSPREGLAALEGGVQHDLLHGKGLDANRQDRVVTNAARRSMQVTEFADAARSDPHPVLIAGDTNLPSLSYVLHEELGAFQDGFAKASWGFGYTFPTTHGLKWMRIDRMFASPALRFVHFEVGHSHVSDHDCIVADLQRAP